MRGAVWLLVLFALVPGGLGAQDSPPESTRAVTVELKFNGPEDGAFTVERGNVTRLEQPAPKQYGTPQMEKLFIELSAPVEGTPEKVVQYAMVVSDPRFHIREQVNDRGQFEGVRVFTPDSTLEVTVPDLPGAELVLYERVENPADGQPSRRELFRTGL